MFIEKNDIITTDGYLDFYKKNSENLCYIKTDFFKCGSFIWRGESHPNKIKKKAIISHSDYPIDDSISEKFEIIFCTNNRSNNENTFSLPLGVANNHTELDILKIIGDKNNLYSVMNTPIQKKNLLYMNFSINTQKSLRNYIFNHYKNFDWVLHDLPSHNENGWLNYLRTVKASKFTLCPRGNGDDTHRLWESIYLGTIPIIEKLKTHDICNDLPVLFVDNWGDLNEEYLNDKYSEMINKKYNMEKLKISYWENFILKKINSGDE